ncbi:hypothetical protein GCM10008085_14170 [Winogradskyella epiphytica]|nr:hypothetical protein GCM10008085_14170 [Winogradskyella epiphytica]
MACVLNLSNAQEKLQGDTSLKNEIPISTNDSLSQTDSDLLLTSMNAGSTYTYNNEWDMEPNFGSLTSNDVLNIEKGHVMIGVPLTCQVINVSPGASLSIDHVVTVTSDIVLSSTDTEFASLITDGIITGTVKYHRFTAKANPNELVSSPLPGESFGDFMSESGTNKDSIATHPYTPTIKAYAIYDMNQRLYRNYNLATDSTEFLLAGKGYRAATVSGNALTYTSTNPTQGDVSIAITNAGDAWNLVGNPYASFLNLGDFLNLDNNSDVFTTEQKSVYFYTGNSHDKWDVWNRAKLDHTPTKLVAPGEAFFVKASSDANLEFTKVMRSHNSGSSARSENSPHYGHLKLKISSGTASFSTDLYFNSNASDGIDPGYDAALYSQTPPAVSIYSHLVEDSSDLALAIQSLHNTAMNNAVIPLGVHAYQGEEITISIEENDMSDDIKIYLEDRLNNTFTLLNSENFVYVPDTNLSGAGRFYLNFENVSLSVKDTNFEKLSIVSNNAENTIVINGLVQVGTNAKLYDVNGRVVLSQPLSVNSSSQEINVSQLTAGVYIMELNSNTNERRIEKLIIN